MSNDKPAHWNNYEVDPDEYESTVFEAPAVRLTKDLMNSAKIMGSHEARYLVNEYYALQRIRLGVNNRFRSLIKQRFAILMESLPENEQEEIKLSLKKLASDKKFEKMQEMVEQPLVLSFLLHQETLLEGMMRSALNKYSLANPVGQWSQSITGVGPVISAGMMAHVNIEKAPSVGHVLRFGGQDPTIVWEKGKKRPFNARLKLIYFHLGQSMRRLYSHKQCFYGHLYKLRKEYEWQRNLNLELKDQAEKYGKNPRNSPRMLAFYKAGILTPSHIDMRAQRWARRIFISHWFDVAYFVRYNTAPPRPYSLAYLNHPDVIAPDNMKMIPGLEKVLLDRSPLMDITTFCESFARKLGFPDRESALAFKRTDMGHSIIGDAANYTTEEAEAETEAE